MLHQPVVEATITVHDLDNLTFNCLLRKGEIVLLGELQVADYSHRIAAHIIARETLKVVIWQDIVGVKHFVYPESLLKDNPSMLDPRSNVVPTGVLVS